MPDPRTYDILSEAYWRSQGERVQRLRATIASRSITAAGRVVPEDDALVIGTGRRLSATVLFIDICGFSQRQSITAEEQELLLRVLNLFFTEMIRIIEDYAGYVEKNTGDGLMAYFEEGAAGTPGENSTKRAVACALTMHAANEVLITPILRATGTPPGVPPIQFRASIEHGVITVARIGVQRGFNANVAIGNAANFAAKMLSRIVAGQIALGSTAWSRLPELWRNSWSHLSPIATDWVHAGTTLPYGLYIYTGRWVLPE